MRQARSFAISVIFVLAWVAAPAFAEAPVLPEAAGYGPSPRLPAPEKDLLPTVEIAPAKGWIDGAKPIPARGTSVSAFATGLDHPRWLFVLPNGDVLVAETAAPERPEDNTGLKGAAMKAAMKKTGTAVPSANRITLLRDADGDGTAETRSVFLSGLNSPFGMDLVGGDFYVANTDAVLRYPYSEGDTTITKGGVRVANLPAGARNHHWTKNVLASRDGTKLYVTVGSNSNVAEHGMEEEAERAAIWEVDAKSGTHRLFATGIRNPNGLAWEPKTGALWTVSNERDELGNDLVPDYMTSVADGAFYGWPYSYFGKHVDDRVKPPRPDLVEKAVAPDYALGSHTASMSLAFTKGGALAERFGEGVFIGQHGSWNRKPRSGYRVIFVPFQAGKPSGAPVDVLTGFVDPVGNALGRPVGVAIDSRGALLVADDVGNAIWRVAAAAKQ